MSDKNPYYSIPTTLGEAGEEVTTLPASEISAMVELRDRIERQIFEAFSPRKLPLTTLRVHGNSFETVELDDAGNIIEPPRRCPKCGPFLLCAEHMAQIT